MASTGIIPRFLLPLQGPLWRGIRIPLSQNIRVRFISASPSSSSTQQPPHKTIVLEKPAKFNPPSHGSRLKKGNALPKHYGPQLTPEEVASQNKSHYPGLMSPEGTWSHWFWHSRILHTVITMGTLFALGIFTFFLNYTHNSPFKDLVPPVSDLWNHPTYFFAAWKNVIAMHEKDKGMRAAEHRTRHLDDVAKRKYFMKMHGIEAKDPVTMIFGKDEGKSEEELEAAAMGKEVEVKKEEGEAARPAKKWFGVF